MRLCIDCKYCDDWSETRADLARCKHPKTVTTTISLVDGSERKTYGHWDGDRNDYACFCETMRKKIGYCGPNADLFEPLHQLAEAA